MWVPGSAWSSEALGGGPLASLAGLVGQADTVARVGGSFGETAKLFQQLSWNHIWPGACYTNTSSMWNQPAQGPFRRFAAAQVDGAGGAAAQEEPGEPARSADSGIVL